MWTTLRLNGHVLHVSRQLRPEYERLMASYGNAHIKKRTPYFMQHIFNVLYVHREKVVNGPSFDRFCNEWGNA